jgi:hypothetical protein
MELMNTFADAIKAHRDTKHVEIEFRLGKMNRDMFDTNVGKDKFERVLKGLRKYPQWEKVTETSDDVFYWGNGVRCIFNDECVYQKKKVLVKKDLRMSSKPLDVRMSIAQELPCEDQESEATRCVKRHRISFLRKNVRIDMTRVSGESTDKDCEDETKYQVELEVLNASSDQLIFSSVHKVLNVLELL